MVHTIRVIPHQHLVMPNGEKHSIYSATASTPGATVRQAGYTWEITSPDGSVTQGMSSKPADTYEEAAEIAVGYAEATGATFLE